jgi:hypothetical protein
MTFTLFVVVILIFIIIFTVILVKLEARVESLELSMNYCAWWSEQFSLRISELSISILRCQAIIRNMQRSKD